MQKGLLKNVMVPTLAVFGSFTFQECFYPFNTKYNSQHPSMILPRSLSVCPDKQSMSPGGKKLLRAPYINYNRGLPLSWTEEMLQRL